MKIIGCSSCFVTSKFPDSQIDSTGTCKWCRGDTLHQEIKEKENLDNLHSLADLIRKEKTGKFDCIIGVSGGLDSSYVAYISKVVMGLNPLLVNYDHGFFYDVPKRNLEVLAKSLDCDIRYIKSNNQWDMKFVSAILKAFSKSGLYWGVCSSCHYILPAVVKRIAKAEGIQYMMSSANEYEAQLHISKAVKLKAMLRSLLAVRLIDLPGVALTLLRAQYFFMRLKMEQYVPPFGNLFRKAPRTNINEVNLTSYVPWDIKHINEVLVKQLGWQTPPSPNLGMRFDCMIEDSFINHTYKEVTGSTIHAIIANNLIHDDVATKMELQPVIDYYDGIIRDREEQVKEKFFKSDNVKK